MTTRRVLSLDGGGVKGVFSVAFRASIEEELGASIGAYFDLIVGTSTGGIIALGLGLGFTAKDLLGFYEGLGGRVFAGYRLLGWLRRIGFARYSPEPLRQALESKFGSFRIGDSMVRLVIPSLNLETGEVHVFKTAHHPRFEKDFKERVVDVAMATAAAPTYFPTYRGASGAPLVDGGMWANNPTGVAVVEAIAVLGWDRAELRVLSLGCTTRPLDIGIGRWWGMGFSYWGSRISDVFMCGQSSGSLGTAQLLVGRENVFRISPVVPGGRFKLDSVGEIQSLRGLGFSEGRKALPMLRQVFFGFPAEKFSPCHSL